MYFKGIHINGFKSFADRLELNFEGGFTGIVGPNGCGKSNVADAIRWVLGEQSPKALRGSNMRDVIFDGTDTRNPLSYCEVSLIFDNSTRLFNVKFDEVAITRKLYRTGESEYLINNVTCRLKDITDMLKDTGLSREGLAIIGQGRVEDIISAKPEDRRKVFEEAAGIARLKAKKRESELRLSRHRMNLERINYILSELERQLGPLKKHAEDAEKYKEYSKDLKYHEINNFLYRTENANDQKADINIKIQGINEEIKSLKNELDNASVSYSKIMEDIGYYDEELEKMQNEQTRILVSIEKVTGEGKVLSERINNDKATRADIVESIEKYRKDIDKKNGALSEAIGSRDKSMREIDELNRELDVVTDKYLKIEEQIVSSESELELTNKNIYTSLDKLSDIKANMSKLIAERDGHIEQLAELDEEQQNSKKRLEDAVASKEEFDKKIELIDKDILEYKNNINNLRAKYNENRVSLNDLNKKIVEANSRKSTLDARNKLLHNMKNSYGSYQMSVKRIMQDSKNNERLTSCIEGVVAELIKVPTEYEVAIETVLGGALQNIVTRTQEDAAYVIDYLKRNNYGRVTFLPMNAFTSKMLDPIYRGALKENGVVGVASDVIKCDKQYRGIVEGLLGRTIIVDNIQNAISLSKRYRNAFRIVTIEGEVLSTSGSMAGGSRRSDKADLLSRERDIENNNKELQLMSKICAQLQEKVKNSANSLESILDDIRIIEEKIQKKEVEKASLSEKIIIAAKLYEDTIVSIELRESKIDSINKRIKEINEQKKLVEQMEKETVSERSSADKVVEESKNQFDAIKTQRDKLYKRRSEIQIGIKERESLIKAFDTDILRYKEELVLVNKNIHDLEIRCDMINAKIEKSVSELHAIALANSDNEQVKEIKAKIEKITSSKKNLQDQLFELDIKKGEINSKINDATSKLIREESRLSKIDNDLANLGDMILDQYQLTYDEAKDIRDSEYDSTQAKSEITRLKKAINALGVVNLNAIEEYKEVGARYEDLNSQKIDLIEAEEDLMQIINELTGEMVGKFKTEFDKINYNFKIVFKELFGGGRAELVLEDEDCDDPLEAGITIKAEPPGKKMQNINLLSGGERALIAIGILFAILKSKPMPFCVLDEIEAALDDSNVKVFATYLRRFSKETQFIVITHRKPTMEFADCLYGVTMQEKGVSNMVSVKLSEAIQNVMPQKDMENVG